MKNEQIMDIVKMRLYGCTLDEIAKKYGVSKQAIRDLIYSIIRGRTTRQLGNTNKIYKDIVYPNIRDRMIDLKWGYSQLARNTGKDVMTIRNVITGFIQSPKLDLALMIAKALDMDVMAAFERGDEPMPKEEMDER